MFFYLLHIPLLNGVAMVVDRIANGVWQTHDPSRGFGLPVVYAAWLLAVAVLYVPCRWFAGVKSRRRDWWLGYL